MRLQCKAISINLKQREQMMLWDVLSSPLQLWRSGSHTPSITSHFLNQPQDVLPKLNLSVVDCVHQDKMYPVQAVKGRAQHAGWQHKRVQCTSRYEGCMPKHWRAKNSWTTDFSLTPRVLVPVCSHTKFIRNHGTSGCTRFSFQHQRWMHILRRMTWRNMLAKSKKGYKGQRSCDLFTLHSNLKALMFVPSFASDQMGFVASTQQRSVITYPRRMLW